MASSTLVPSAGKSLSPEPPLSFSGRFSRHNLKSFVSIPIPRVKAPCIRASAASIEYPSLTAREKVGVFTDNLDGWMRESVVEIVKSLKNSPLMVHVYCNDATEVKSERGASENWSDLLQEWRDGEKRSPDGIILVQQLEDNKIEYDDDRSVDFEDADLTSTLTCTRKKSWETVSVKAEEEDGTKAWGVLVQGKGKERECSRTACYLLKTCRVNSGLGLCGTHFSLVKVKNFRESAFSQIKNSWLL
ncbi:hypothetical protein DCAR_0416239 [Daucus carota subsp. sativus]|uniref:DUF7804 domain-containing protein n=1 Tax=Daucus carota subsp. sativus TaxID=79200 RepID=A0A165XAB8_DAUCS|nr:PREDICTED: uncharacterized protein LOC108216317 [Daucus carota subsp. sativus]WOG96901.1 hypothetical protein DCAR_0416239 [Daucus carota subsp. sativus]